MIKFRFKLILEASLHYQTKKRHKMQYRCNIEIDHPVITFNDIPLKKVSEHKHLGIILDSKLSFSAHINAAISKTRKGIGLLKCLSKYLPRKTLSELYKLYVFPATFPSKLLLQPEQQNTGQTLTFPLDLTRSYLGDGII